VSQKFSVEKRLLEKYPFPITLLNLIRQNAEMRLAKFLFDIKFLRIFPTVKTISFLFTETNQIFKVFVDVKD
jgi:hypothetical protein